MKSFLSLDRSATFTCRKDGIERKYLVYEGAEFVNYDMIYEGSTKEENGVIAEVQIKHHNEKMEFSKKALQKLAYYDTAVLIIDGVVQTNDIYRNDLFQWSTFNNNSSMHLCLKDVYYTIDWDALGIDAISVPIALRFSLSDGMIPTPSRESYITNDKVKKIILERIENVANWFVKRYNERVSNFDNFMDAFPHLSKSTLYVEVADQHFMIDPLIPYSKRTVTTAKVKGLSLKDPYYYKSIDQNILYEWEAIGYSNDKGITKKLPRYRDLYWFIFHDRMKVVRVDALRGNVRDFLKYKYGSGTLFVKPNGKKRALGKPKDPWGTLSYMNILGLSSVPKDEWRPLIQEWQTVVSHVTSRFKDETKVADTQEFKDWVENKKRLRKVRKGDGKSYTGLNKKKDEVTMAYNYISHLGVSFKKETFKVSSLRSNKFLTILLTEDDDLKLVKSIIEMVKGDKIRFALMGKNEIKKIPKHFQFINFEEFMGKDCKPFKRLASAILYERTLKELKNISDYRSGAFKKFIKDLKEDEKALQNYVNLNMERISDTGAGHILDVAKKYNLYDYSIWDKYLRIKKAVDSYDFVNLLQHPLSWDEESKRRYRKLIAQVLLFRKKYYNELPDGIEIVFDTVAEKV